MLKLKLKKFFNISVKIGVIAVYVLCIAVLISQALTPGSESSNISNSVGDKIDNIVTTIKKPEAERVSVQKVSIDKIRILNEDFSTKSRIVMGVGSVGKLSCTVLPANASNKSLVYSSSDPEIINVYADGSILTKKEGSANITVTSKENDDITDTVKIKVESIPIKKLKLSDEEMEIHISQTVVLDVSFSPSDTTERDVSWSVSDGSILNVTENGRITAIAEGVATVTATSKLNKEVFDTVEITVTPIPPVPPVEEIKLKSDKSVGYVGKTAKLTTTFYPADSSDKLIYSVSDETVATVDQSGLVTFLSSGEVTLYVKCSTYEPEDSIDITVKEVLSESITLSFEGLSENGDGYSLKIALAGKVIASLNEDATVRDVNFESSDPNIATINEDGTIDARSEGEVTITVYSTYDGETTTVSFDLTVNGYTYSDTMENFSLWVRKSFGHFGAFLFMGIFASFSYLIIFPKNAKGKFFAFITCIITGFVLAGLTEILQLPIFTAGRYCSFKDVLIDFSGYCCSSVVIYVTVFITHFIKWLINRINRNGRGGGSTKKQQPLTEIPLSELKLSSIQV